MAKKQTLTFIDVKARYICEAFGMSETLYDMLFKSMHNFFESTDKFDNYPTLTKVELLQAYLDSEEFAGLNFTPQTPNDFFMLGYVFQKMVDHLHGKMMRKGIQGMVVDAMTSVAQSDDDDEEGGFTN